MQKVFGVCGENEGGLVFSETWGRLMRGVTGKVGGGLMIESNIIKKAAPE